MNEFYDRVNDCDRHPTGLWAAVRLVWLKSQLVTDRPCCYFIGNLVCKYVW